MLSRAFFCFFIMVISNMCQAEWTPPDDPDLQEILTEAGEDRRSGHYKEALEKHIWFHDESLNIDRSFYGVRLSFALAEWVELVKVYPPAKKKLVETSDKNEGLVKEGGDCSREAFHDFVSINREMGRDEKVVELFKWVHLNHPEKAKRFFSLAQPALVKSNEYMLSGKYIDPNKDLAKLSDMYNRNYELSKDPKFGKEMQEFAEKSFSNSVCILVATLVLNERDREAEDIAYKSKEILNSESFKNDLDKALKGNMPNPWP